MNQKGKRINEEIRANRVNVINSNWENLWILPIEKALEIAGDSNMDLVELWVWEWWLIMTKIMDYGKFLFKQQKNISKSKSNTKKHELKTIRLTYRIWDHDLDIRKKQAEKFAKEWHPLKISLMLKWRENQYEKLAVEKIEQFISSIEEIYKLDWKLSKAGTTFSAILSPKK